MMTCNLLYVISILSFSILARWCVTLGPYSGKGKPPMFGDYEAQRHWMEVTFNLPTAEWYRNTTDNDLMYWGLDYPPLTAYHSWLCGYVSDKFNASWNALHKSRGLEIAEHKLFMRYTVLVADLFVFLPAVMTYFSKCCSGFSSKYKLLCCLLTILYPGLLLIDHGHFQYNCVSLGLFVWAVVGVSTGHHLMSCVAFVLALNYKQMELYHALPFFSYLLGSSFTGQQFWLWKLTKLGVVVITTFALCWLPFLSDQEVALSVLGRLFPFARGLYEDKVANVWCSLAVVIKLKELLDISNLIKVCLGSTFVLLLPSSLHLLLHPNVKAFKYALVNASLTFFLFSFQVHEKSILLPALAACLLLPECLFMGIWFLLISTFSMLPLMLKDGLLVPFVASSIMFYSLASITFESDAPKQDYSALKKAKQGTSKQQRSSRETLSQIPREQPSLVMFMMFCLSVAGAVMLTVASLSWTPPAHLPDLLPVLVSTYSCGHFVFFLMFYHWKQLTLSSSKQS